MAVKTVTESVAVIPAMRAALAQIDPQLPLADIQTMGERTAQSLAAERLVTGLAALFGGVALVLSVLGLYSVLAYVVAQRQRAGRRVVRQVDGDGRGDAAPQVAGRVQQQQVDVAVRPNRRDHLQVGRGQRREPEHRKAGRPAEQGVDRVDAIGEVHFRHAVVVFADPIDGEICGLLSESPSDFCVFSVKNGGFSE